MTTAITRVQSDGDEPLVLRNGGLRRDVSAGRVERRGGGGLMDHPTHDSRQLTASQWLLPVFFDVGPARRSSGSIEHLPH